MARRPLCRHFSRDSTTLLDSTSQDAPLTVRPNPPAGDRPAEGATLLPLPDYGQGSGAPSELDGNPRYRTFELQSAVLPGSRTVRVYLPEAYEREPERRFPVFLLHDGQNLFDGRTSYIPGHTWRAHTTADRLTRENRIEPVVLVGIDNTGLRRMAEYTPTRDPMRGGGDGERYGHLLTGELLPLLRNEFRLLPGAEHTGLGGSSLGGLISLAIGLEYPQTFGRLAVMSPSLWWNNRSIFEWLARRVPSRTSRIRPKFAPPPEEFPHPTIWLDMGTHEGLRHVRDAEMMHRRLQERGWRDGEDVRFLLTPGGLHTEDAWAARFDQVLAFLFPRQS